MARKKTRRKKGSKGSGGGPARRGAPRPKGPGPLKGMVIGAVIFAAISAFFMLRVGGDTPFNHLIKALGGGDDAAAEEGATAPSGRAAPAEAPARPRVAKSARKAPPMEDVTPEDQKDLERLIEQRTR